MDFRQLIPDADPKPSPPKRGHLKIFIGYAPGVGKTYTMLNEANRRAGRGQDVVIGFVEAHGREETNKQIGNLETIPCLSYHNEGNTAGEMDTEAIIARNPSLVVIDELAHTNAPDIQHQKRYEDVEEILNRGIHVLTTLNIQHLESLNDVVKQITGLAVRETIPDKIVEQADEVVVVDITPDALLNRLKRGNIYPPEEINPSLRNFFRKGNLNALRELALRQTAEEVDEKLKEYMDEHGIKENWHLVERVMVCITPDPSAKKLIRRGARIAKRYRSEWVVVSVNCTRFPAPKPSPKEREMLEGHFKLARQLGAEVIELSGKSISGELSKFSADRHITQIIIGHSTRTKLQSFFRGSTIDKLLKKTRTAEVHVIPNEL